MANIPSGLDRADGLGGRLGVASPDGAIRVQSRDPVTGAALYDDIEQSPVQEYPGYELERAEQATISRMLHMGFDEAITRSLVMGRGTIRTDSFGNITKILSCKVTREAGGYAKMAVVEEGLSFDSPPDQFSLQPVELGVDIIKHPRYFYAFMGNDGYGSTTEQFNQQVIRLLQDYRENQTAAYREGIIAILKNNLTANTTGTPGDMPNYCPNGKAINKNVPIYGTEMAKRAAIEIIVKLWRGEETPYLTGWQITHSYFTFRPPYINPGGYIEDPITEASPQLPEYFWSPTWPTSTSVTIFDYIAAINPQSYSSDGTASGSPSISWLRKADILDFERTFFKVTRTWIGSPVGYWDPQFYAATARPSVPDDFIPLNKLT